MVILSWTVHTRYLLWELQQLTTNLIGVTIPDQGQGTTVKTETETEDTATDFTETHLTNHITDHLNTEALQAINPNIIVGHTYNQHTGLQGMNCINQTHNPVGQGDNHTTRRTCR